MAAPFETQSVPADPHLPVLDAAKSRRALGGFFLTGVLFSFLGAILPAWGYHLRSDYSTIGLYFLFLTFGIYAGAQVCNRLVARTGVRALLLAGSITACAALLGLASLSGEQPPSYRMFLLLLVGAAGAMINTAVFHAIAPIYEYDKAATLNLSGALFGGGCLATAVLTAGTFGLYTVPSMLILLAVIPAYFVIGYWQGDEFAVVPRETRSFREALNDFRSPGAVLFSLLLFFQFGNEWAIAGWLPLFLIQQLGTSPSNGLLLLCFYWVALLIGRLAAQVFLQTVRPSRMLIASVNAALLGCILLSFSEKLGGAVTAIFLIGSGFASIYPLTAQSIEHRFPYYHPAFFSGIFSLGLVGGLITPSLMGWVAGEWGIGKVMLLPALGSLMVSILVLLIWLEARLSTPRRD